MNSLARIRLWGVTRKESLQILRDPSSIAIAFAMPVILLYLFGYGVSLDAKHIPLGIVIEQPDTTTQSLAGAFERSEFFRPLHFGSIKTAQQALDERKIDAIIWLRNNFSAQLLSGSEAPIGIILTGVDSNQANITQGYIQAAWLTWLNLYAKSHSQSPAMPVIVEHRVSFNASLNSRLYLVSELIAIVMTLIGSLLTAMVVAREWERGTIEALLVTPLHKGELLADKLIPHFVLGMGGMLFSVFVALWQFDVPLRGSFWLLMLSSGLFMLLALAIGLLISIVSKNQFVAGILAIIVTFLPPFLMSGFLFEINSMPSMMQLFTGLVPARYFVTILQTLFLARDVWPVMLFNMGALCIMLVLFGTLVWRKFNKRLE